MKKFIIKPHGSISVDLVEGKIKVISLPSKFNNKFQEKYPNGIIGDPSDYIDDKKLLKLVRKIFNFLLKSGDA